MKHEEMMIRQLEFYFFVNPGQPIWPMIRSLYQVDHWVGFKTMPGGSGGWIAILNSLTIC
jgi:hypothetical protein